MTSEERREARYRRRQAARDARRRERCEALGSAEGVFSFHNLVKYGTACCTGLRWKASTVNFEKRLFSRSAVRCREAQNGAFSQRALNQFDIHERGHFRHIGAPHITDRQIHKVISKEILTPLYAPSMIYDNGASQPGKGLQFHYRRLAEQLRWQFRRTGLDGAVMLADFHDYFGSAPREVLFARHERYIPDARLRAAADAVVASAPGERGMPLGVEPSQQEMVALPSALDNYLKCQMSIHGAGHYMDDYVAVLPTREDAERALEEFIARAEALGLQVNRNKCRVVGMDKPFRFCKAKFIVTASGRVIVHGARDGVKRARRKMRAFRRMADAGTISADEVRDSVQGHAAYYEKFCDHGRALRIRRMYHALFEEDNKHV